MGGMSVSKRLSSISLSSLKGKLKKKPKVKSLTLDCSSTSSTESLLRRLEDAQHEPITHLILHDSLQRHDSVAIYNALSTLVNSKHCHLKQVRLIEPRVPAADYRRWSFKKTNFLRHVYQDCQDQDIEIKIHATLVLETAENKPQDVSTWLLTHFPRTIPQDRDIKSLSISLRDVQPDGKRIRCDVERVFQGLIEIFNHDKRRWDYIDCHVLYPAATIPKYAVPQTEALVEVAQAYDIPLQVQWEPLDGDASADGAWIKSTSRQAVGLLPAKKKVLPSNPPRKTLLTPIEDTTASTVEYEGSSGAFAGF